MKSVFILVLSLACFKCFSDIVPLPEITSTIVRQSDVNRFHRALGLDVLPRNSAGVVTDLSASLGSSTLPWSNLKLSESFNLRNQFGSVTVHSANMLSGAVTNTSYTSHLSSTIPITTNGRPLFFFSNGQTASSTTFIHFLSSASSIVPNGPCEFFWRILIDSTVVVEQRMGNGAQETGSVTEGISRRHPTSTVWAVYDGLPAGTYTIDFQFKQTETSSTGCTSIEVTNGKFNVFEY